MASTVKYQSSDTLLLIIFEIAELGCRVAKKWLGFRRLHGIKYMTSDSGDD